MNTTHHNHLHQFYNLAEKTLVTSETDLSQQELKQARRQGSQKMEGRVFTRIHQKILEENADKKRNKGKYKERKKSL